MSERTTPAGVTPDLAVIGGGIIGCAAAALAAERGLHVRVYEQTAIGAGASGRNLGSVQHPYEPLLEPLYDASVEHYRALTDADLGFQLPDAPAGVLLVATDADALAHHAARLASALPALAPTFLAPDEANLAEPMLAPDVAAILLARTGFPVPPSSATAAYAELAQRHGVEFRLGASAWPAVTGDRVDGVWVDGALEPAERVLVAAGPWTPEVLGADLRRWAPIARLWGVTLRLQLGGELRHILEEEVIADARLGGSFRWSLPEEGQLAFSLASAGGMATLGSSFLPVEPDPPAVWPRIVERGARFVPAVAGAPIVDRRLCARPLSADGRPFIGAVPGIEGLHLCAGHGPWGISTGPASAALAVEAILDPQTHPIPAALSVSRLTEGAARTQ